MKSPLDHLHPRFRPGYSEILTSARMVERLSDALFCKISNRTGFFKFCILS
jgi:hypothetical protein